MALRPALATAVALVYFVIAVYIVPRIPQVVGGWLFVIVSGRHLDIAMTAHSMTADRDRCLAAGMVDYTSKPVSLGRLSAILARWVRAPGEPVSSEA